MNLTRCVTFVIAGILISSCRSAPERVLEPIQEQPTGYQAVEENVPLSAPSLAAKVVSQLRELGYQGIGFNYENDATLDLLSRVFSHPAVANRQIESVYTGMALAYDSKHKSLTIGGTLLVEKIVEFIKRAVPLRPVK